MRDVDRVAGAWDFDRVATSSVGVPSFKVRVNGSVFCRYQHPARFASPRSRGDDCLDVTKSLEHQRTDHETSLFGRQHGAEVLAKLRGVEVSGTVRGPFEHRSLTQITGEAFSEVSLILS